MSQGRHELLILLDLLAGNLPAEEGTALRRRLAEDEPLRELWRCVSTAWHEMPAPAAAAVVHVHSTEHVGAFLEGRLSAAAAKAIGEECRHDPALVEEIVAAYRLQDRTTRAEQAPGRLTQRLLALRASKPATVEPAAAVPRQEAWTFAESPSPAPEPGDRKPPRVLTRVGRRGGRGPNGALVRSPRAVIAVTVAMAVLGISLFAAWQFGRSRGTDPNEGLTRDRGSDGPSPAERLVDGGGADRPLEQPDAPTRGREIARDDVSPPPTPPDSPHVPPPTVPDHTAPSTSGTVVDAQWDQIIGLVAVAGTGTDNWLGAQAPRAAASSITFASLPGSWAAGRIAGTGEFVLDADTRITWSAAARPGGPQRIEIDRGRCALRGLSQGTEFLIAGGGDETRVRVDEPGTLVVLDQNGGTRQVAVLSGGADVGGNIVRRRQFVAWTGGAWSTPRTLDAPPTFVAGPESAAPIDSAEQQSLLTSADLLASLSALDASVSPPLRQTAVGWRLSLAPQAMILASLRSSYESTRTAAVAWLMDDRPNDSSQDLAWQAFARELNDPELARSLRRWVQLASSGRAPARSDLGDLLAGLDHAELGVRQFAQTCLERITGRRAPAYRADGSAAERQAGIRQWRGIIIRNPPTRRGRSRQSTSR
jgi:hypothetical protein